MRRSVRAKFVALSHLGISYFQATPCHLKPLMLLYVVEFNNTVKEKRFYLSFMELRLSPGIVSDGVSYG